MRAQEHILRLLAQVEYYWHSELYCLDREYDSYRIPIQTDPQACNLGRKD